MGLEWSDLNPLTWPGQVKKRLHDDNQMLTGDSQSAIDKRNQLTAQGQAAGNFANAGETGYSGLGWEAAMQREALRRRSAGENSVTAEQLRQGLAQNVAAQRSMAAGAPPSMQAMAARTAMMNTNRLGSAMAGQSAIARLQEQQAAEKALADAIAQQRALEANVALGSRQNAIAGYGGVTPEGSFMDKWGGAISAGLGAYATMKGKK